MLSLVAAALFQLILYITLALQPSTLKKGNVAGAVMMASVIIATAVIIQAGVMGITSDLI